MLTNVREPLVYGEDGGIRQNEIDSCRKEQDRVDLEDLDVGASTPPKGKWTLSCKQIYQQTHTTNNGDPKQKSQSLHRDSSRNTISNLTKTSLQLSEATIDATCNLQQRGRGMELEQMGVKIQFLCSDCEMIEEKATQIDLCTLANGMQFSTRL